MISDHNFAREYITELYTVASLEERFSVYEKYILLLDFSGATYTFAPRMQWEALPSLPAIFLYTKDYPIDFLQEYQSKRFDRKDFTVRKVLEGETAPMDWRQHELQELVTEDELSLIHLAREKYNINNAISIPTMFEERGAAGASVISFANNDTFLETKNKNLEKLLFITRLFHETNFTDLHKFIIPVFESLKPREITVLHYKASGKPMKNIYDHTGITSEASAKIIHNMKKRLGGINNDRLMYLFTLLISIDDSST